MNGRHVWRTKPPALGSFLSGNRGIWIGLSLLLPLAAAVPALWDYFDRPPQEEVVDDIEAVIKKFYRHDPLTPPSRLRAPGSIYLVDGNLLRNVCLADPEVVRKHIQESTTQDRTSNAAAGTRFIFGGNAVDSLNAKLSGARVESIEFGIKGATIQEIPEAILGRIERLLMNDPDCEYAVSGMLAANKKVCSGYSSLTASISYKVRFARGSELTAESKLEYADVIRETIEAHGGGTVSVRNAEEYSGEKLIYGVLLSSRCFVPDTTAGRASGKGGPSQMATTPRT
jgi:hypothetical protein